MSAPEQTEGGVYQCRADELWFPGRSLDLIYPEITPEELAGSWQRYSGRETQLLIDVLGVCTAPDRDIKAVASIDVCEVLRQTLASMDLATGVQLGKRNHYSQGTWYHEGVASYEIERSTIQSVAQVLFNNGLIAPVDGINDIAVQLQDWRRRGIYTVANTSTLPGCERATVDRYFTENLPDCFDAIVFPRNHDGTGKVTKAHALEIMASEVDLGHRTLPLTHIDDVVHHVEGFMTHYADHPNMAYFVPKYIGNEHAPEGTHCDTPLDAFLNADEWFRKGGI